MQTNPLRRQFPALSQRINGHPLAYLDSAATAQKPATVIAAIQQFYRRDNANVHRGVHQLSDRATDAYEQARSKLADWLGSEPEQVVWTSGTTAGVNLLATALASTVIGAGDQILVSALEHHANLIPWQQVARACGAELVIAPIDAQGQIDINRFKAQLNARVKVVAFTHLSNVLGTIQPVAELCALARSVGAISVVDGAQAVAHLSPKPAELGCDFYLFSGHKLYGPTGIGVLWGRKAALEALPPWQTGGEMVVDVGYQHASFAGLPHRLEAGTPNIAGAIGLAAAVEFIQQQNWAAVVAEEQRLGELCQQQLLTIPGVRLLPHSEPVAGVIGFTLEGYHPADVAQWLDRHGVAVRAGHHCAQPLHDSLGIPGSIRVSIACYTSQSEIEQLIGALRQLSGQVETETTAASQQLDSQSLLERAAQSKGWEATYQLLLAASVAIGERPAIRRREHQVAGCDSRTWVAVLQDAEQQWSLQMDSESAVIRGLLAIIAAVAEQLPVNQWQRVIFAQRLEELNLLPFISATRVNGINAVLQRIEDQLSASCNSR